MNDETDFWGELRSAVREQERIVQARKLVEGIKALPSNQREKQAECLKLLGELLELNGMEVSRRHMLYLRSLQPGPSWTESREYDDLCECPFCSKETPHRVHDSGHERDSSNDWRQCKACGARWSGLTGRYGPPAEG